MLWVAGIALATAVSVGVILLGLHFGGIAGGIALPFVLITLFIAWRDSGL